MQPTKKLPVHWDWKDVAWPSALFLIGVPIAASIAIPLYFYYGTSSSETWLKTMVWGAVLGVLSNLSITAGYHRLFSHKSYEAHPLLRIILLLIGAGAWQGTCLQWASDHRIHHRFVDKHEDPYAITKGFFYAHFGWLLLKDKTGRKINAPDLQKDPWVMIQNNYYLPIAVFMGFIFPALIASLWGDFWGGLGIAGFLRIFLTQQSTYFVNSLSHTIGGRPYSTEISARDSLLVAFLTHGEGYHNFHHKFQLDYRNGILWWQWDPTKWVIWSCAKVGLASGLKKIPSHEILKARLQTEAARLVEKGFSEEKLIQLREQILSAQIRLRGLSQDYLKARQRLRQGSQDRMDQVRTEIARTRTEMELARLEFRVGLDRWRIWLRSQVPVN
jgi:stearoyl-CoA desaturase (delta-9 desaturase)